MSILRRFNQLEVDGYVSLLLLSLAVPGAIVVARLVEYFDVWESAFGGWTGGLALYSFSIGFAISGFRQLDRGGRFCSGITLFLAAGFFLLGLLPSIAR